MGASKRLHQAKTEAKVARARSNSRGAGSSGAGSSGAGSSVGRGQGVTATGQLSELDRQVVDGDAVNLLRGTGKREAAA